MGVGSWIRPLREEAVAFDARPPRLQPRQRLRGKVALGTQRGGAAGAPLGGNVIAVGGRGGLLELPNEHEQVGRLAEECAGSGVPLSSTSTTSTTSTTSFFVSIAFVIAIDATKYMA